MLSNETNFPAFPKRFILRLEDYELLGKVDNGTVAIYQHRLSGHRIAYKPFTSIPHEKAYRIIEKFQGLSHPSLAEFCGFAWPDGGVATKFIADSSLTKVLAASPRWWTAAAQSVAISQLASALHYLHSHGLAHGKLTPDAVFVSEDARLHLCYFPSERCCDLAADICAFGQILAAITRAPAAAAMASACLDPESRPSFAEICDALGVL
jgi:serine/threonine protein kinase